MKLTKEERQIKKDIKAGNYKSIGMDICKKCLRPRIDAVHWGQVEDSHKFEERK